MVVNNQRHCLCFPPPSLVSFPVMSYLSFRYTFIYSRTVNVITIARKFVSNMCSAHIQSNTTTIQTISLSKRYPCVHYTYEIRSTRDFPFIYPLIPKLIHKSIQTATNYSFHSYFSQEEKKPN